jgi:hypothetical protein
MEDWDRLNVINAAKAWYRGIMQGVHWRDEAGRKVVLASLSPALRRLAFMVIRLLEEEKKGRSKSHLHVVR